jgi:hypothetical protein
MNSSKVENYKESNQVDSYGQVAVVSYQFDLKYRTKGILYHDTGRDVFVLLRGRKRWRANLENADHIGKIRGPKRIRSLRPTLVRSRNL